MIGLIMWLAMAAGQAVGGNTCHKVPAGDGCNTCTVCENSVTTCTLAMCMKSPAFMAGNEPAEPIDVPAVWKKRHVPMMAQGCGSETMLCANDTFIPEHDEQYPTCADESRVLLVSVNGKQAVCHKITP